MSLISEHVAELNLVDHHCHGLVMEDLPRGEFELLATESDWPAPPPTTWFDSPLGTFIRAECAPVLDLPRHCSPEDYLQRRAHLGVAEVTGRLLRDSGIGEFVVDTGFHGDRVSSPRQLAEVSGFPAHQVTRLETLAQTVAPGASAEGFVRDVHDAIQAAALTSVGFKSIIAYRFGLDFDPTPPGPAEVLRAASEWLSACETAGSWRLDHPVLLRHLLWEAVPLQRPIQFHVGYGDSDITLHRCDPSQMTGFLRATVGSGTDIMLLHCYPFIREAGILAQVFPHVYLDTGLTVTHAGASAGTLVRESLEVAPFGKVLFASDAYGLPELYLAGSLLWRRAVGELLDEWVASDAMGRDDALRYASWMAGDNARRVYGLEEAT